MKMDFRNKRKATFLIEKPRHGGWFGPVLSNAYRTAGASARSFLLVGESGYSVSDL